MENDLIRRSDALKELWYPFDFTRTEIDINIKHIPAVDAVEVVHGEWIKSKYPGFAFCSVCNNCYIQTEFIEQSKGGSKWKYCPDCGARMDGEGEHNAAD